MKKLLIVLAILLLAGSSAFAMDMAGEVSGRLGVGFVASGSPIASAEVVPQAEIIVTGHAGDFTTVGVELDYEGGAYPVIAVDEAKISTSVLSALGVDAPVSVDLSLGMYENYHSNFNFVNSSITVAWNDFSGEAWNYFAQGWESDQVAGGVKIGFGDFALHYWNTFDFGQMSVAFSGAVSVLNFVVGFAADYAAIGNGTIWAELGANVDLGSMSLFIPANFALTIGPTLGWEWASGVKLGIGDIATVAIGAAGEDGQVFRKLVPEVHLTALAGLDAYVVAWIDLLANSSFKSIDIGATYALGGLSVNPGVVIALNAADSTSLGSSGDDQGITGTGFYLLFQASF